MELKKTLRTVLNEPPDVILCLPTIGLLIEEALAVEASVMQHFQYGINSLTNFAVARCLSLLRGILRHYFSSVFS